MNRKTMHSGFTLIELLLAMTFISVLLISIALLVMQISTLYNRGTTLRQVNISGRVLVEDIERTLTSSSSSVDSSKIAEGRLCMGDFSYVWNTAAKLKEADRNRYAGVSHSGKDLRFVRVPDSTRQYCSAGLPSVTFNGAVELLAPGDRRLAVHDMRIAAGPTNPTTMQQLYRVSFLLGTDDTGVIDTTKESCDPADDPSLSYCAINRFIFTVRTGGGQES